MSVVEQGPSDLDESALSALGHNWYLVLFMGIISLLIGIVALAWPVATIFVIAMLLAIWLIISGIFEVVRSFQSGLSGGMRALLIITGLLSVILGLFALSGAFQAAEILAIFIGISFLFRGFGSLLVSAERKEGRGWNIFGGIIMLIGGLAILGWPSITLVALAWVAGIWLIVIGLFEIIAAFRLRSLAKAV